MNEKENFDLLKEVLASEARRSGYKEIMGVTSFKEVYERLMQVQRVKLEELSGSKFSEMLDHGSVVCIAFAYPEYAINAIANGVEGKWEKEKWSVYARAYNRLNQALNSASLAIAEELRGISIPATTMGMASKVSHVEDYYSKVISHRVVAELAGVGWRGKNELIVNPKYSCAIRLSSILTPLPINHTTSLTKDCGKCNACFEACKFLKYKEKLKNYREQCRRYMLHIGLDEEVCGKCIKACYTSSIYRDQFKL